MTGLDLSDPASFFSVPAALIGLAREAEPREHVAYAVLRPVTGPHDQVDGGPR
jgi:hypothetical protein